MMKKGFLILAAAGLFPISAVAQMAPTLAITNDNGLAVVYWTGAAGNFSLQAGTNLSHPMTWVDQQSRLATDGATGLPATHSQQFFRLASRLPLFQFAIFYDVNLEFMSATRFYVVGPVFCNQGIWAGSTLLTFDSTVAAAGTISTATNDPYSTYIGSGRPAFLLADQPVAQAPPLGLVGFSGNASIAGLRNIIDLPPTNAAMGTPGAYTPAGARYAANACDIVITNFAFGTNNGAKVSGGTNLMVYFQDSGLTQIPYDYYLATNPTTHALAATNFVPPELGSNIFFAGFSWITNAVFYDWREGWNGGSGPAKRVEAVQIDIAKFARWLTNDTASNSGHLYDQTKLLHAGHHIDSVYVYTSVAETAVRLPAIRLVNGWQLPSASGLTVATPFPMYVLGDYNVQTPAGPYGRDSNGVITNTYPAALMADSLTVLSLSWTDPVSAVKLSGGPNVTADLTLNAAVIAGVVPSDPTVSGDYSGGVENFFRLLENWGNDTLTFNGAIVVPFYSQYATNHWRQTYNYYAAPTRRWTFDLNFQDATKLPPLTPMVENYVTP